MDPSLEHDRSEPGAGDQPATLAAIDWERYGFLDIGCSSGGSLDHCTRRFDVQRGLGIDLDGTKVAAARQRGLDAVQGDVLDIATRDVVRFVSMMQFLEHLPDFELVERILGKAAELGTDFLYIDHPSFEDEQMLLAHGLRLYYHRWSGHKSHLLCTDFFAMFERLGLLRYHVRPRGPIRDSRHRAVIPVGLPKNQREYDREQHGPKAEVTFARPVYQHLEIFVALRPVTDPEWKRIVQP